MATIASIDGVRSRASRLGRDRAGRVRLASTRLFYERHADAYAASTAAIDVSDRLHRFASMLPAGGRVLDAGCGAGRDLARFAALGFDAIGVDLSAPLAAIARRVSGREVVVTDLLTADLGREAFDGIWAMASLLHVGRDELPDALGNLRDALRPGGILFASVKRGVGDIADDTGRWFTLHDEAGWADHLRRAGLEVLEVVGEPADEGVATGSVAPGWISSLSRTP